MGLLGGNSRPMSERVPGIDTSNWGPGGSADKSPDEIAPMPYLTDRQMMDPRLEPSVLMQRDRFNNSSVSLGDDQDYSRRVLRVRYPIRDMLVPGPLLLCRFILWHVSSY